MCLNNCTDINICISTSIHTYIYIYHSYFHIFWQLKNISTYAYNQYYCQSTSIHVYIHIFIYEYSSVEFKFPCNYKLMILPWWWTSSTQLVACNGTIRLRFLASKFSLFSSDYVLQYTITLKLWSYFTY